MSRKNQTSTTRAGAAGNLSYVPWTRSFPTQAPTVQIVFHGLLCFFFDGSNLCEVGIHNTTHAQHPNQPHDLTGAVWTNIGGVCQSLLPRKTVGDPHAMNGDINIHVSGSATPNGVYVYEPGTFQRPDPQNQNDPRDWRWMIDFERDVYPGGVGTKHPSRFRPDIKITNGLFYTFHKTDSQFELRAPGRSPKVLGSVAEVVACNIYLQPLGQVILSGGPFAGLPPLLALPGVTYQVDITNNCNSVFQGCRYRNNGSTKEERNDFYLYYETFDRPANEPEYELICTQPRNPPANIGLCVESIAKDVVIAMTDDAPCGATGFGQSPPP